MADPILRHYRTTNPATANTIFSVTGAIPPARALVVSKIIAWNLQVAATVVLYVGPTAEAATVIGIFILNSDKEGYMETGVIVSAGEHVYARTDNATAVTLVVHVFGQEIDNVV